MFLTSCKSIKHKPSIDFNEDIEKEVYQSFLGLVDAAKALVVLRQ
ncbi:hypothetical protein [Pleionea sp. CnH1-48]|nr:hypothetical protein [Pleionea sp. CnH1-48]